MIVSAYVFWNCLAAIYMAVVSVIFLKQLKISYKHIVIIDVLVVLSFFIGSRLMYAVLYPSRILVMPSKLWALKLVNFSLYGGLIMALLAWLLIGRLWRLKQLLFADNIVPHLGIAVALSKLGCFFNGCCYGVVSDVPWAMHFERADQSFLTRAFGNSPLLGVIDASTAILRHPTQLYEVGATMTVVCLTFGLLHMRRFPPTTSILNQEGLILSFFSLFYSVWRLLIFNLREFPGATALSSFVRGPLLYGLVIVISILFIIVAVIKNKENSHPKSVTAK